MLAITALRRLTLRAPATPAVLAAPSRAYSARNGGANTNGKGDSSSPDAAAEKRVTDDLDKVEHAAEDIVKQVVGLEAQVKELKSALTYGKADFINLQRRTEQEKASMRDFAIQAFASDLLSTVDILTTALSHVPQPVPAEAKDLAALFSGVQMTRGELLKTLAKHGVVPFNPLGEKFDPNKHEALFQAPHDSKEPGTVMDCQKEGYMIKSRTLRPAQVGVVQDKS
ncbi:hypothetical protein QFC19_003354 [Naganishia cerealis]|uniref:Uncharacterized protein n=1 Tax=Naganishia cerealis TaxID=610337 RepID=A0ACC2W3I0_9TREE|nr:hypothetical protein QFC19_003354 [Naganishia cerealis]